jgi:hypothetical protein
VRSLIRSLGVVAFGVMLMTTACNPTSPTDTSPGALDVRISVLDIYPNQNDLAVIMQFLSGGNVVKFVNGETVTCNNVALSYNGLTSGYAGRVTQVAPGGKYRFVYTRSGTQTTVEVTAPPRPAILTPAANAQVPRTTNLTITYTSAGGAAVRGGASDASSSAGNPGEQSDNGTYTGLDVSSLKAGPGLVSLTRILRSTDTSTAFKSVAVEYDVSSEIPVTWT